MVYMVGSDVKALFFQYWEDEPPGPDSNAAPAPDGYWRHSVASIGAYARRCGAEYQLRTGGAPISPFYGIFTPFLDGTCDAFDLVVFFDCDVMATPGARNILDHLTGGVQAHRMDQGPVERRRMVARFNSGVVAVPRPEYGPMKAHLRRLEQMHAGSQAMRRNGNREQAAGGFDQYVLNQYPVRPLDWKFNYHLGRFPHEGRFEADLIHYHRAHKAMMPDGLA